MDDSVPCTPPAQAVAATTPRVVCSMPRAELIRLCQLYGPNVRVEGCTAPDGSALDGVRLLFAMSGRESSFGANLTPRFEKSYYVDGAYWQRSLQVKQFVARWGREGAMSYGPLQVLAINALGFSPIELAASPEAALKAAIGFLNRAALVHFRSNTLADICDCWNTGNDRDANIPHAYIDAVTKHYAECAAELKWSAHVDLER